MSQSTYDALIQSLREIALLRSVAELLGWDERTQLPSAGAEHRSNQFSLLARMVHEQFTSPRIGELLSAVEGTDLMRDPESDAAVNVRETRRSYDRSRKLPSSLVEEMAKTEVMSQHAWGEAKKESNYPKFQPWLEKWLKLKNEEARCVGFKDHPYNALLDPFEPDETVANLTNVFESLRGPLVELIGKISASSKQAPVHVLERKYPCDLQEKISRQAAADVGFDFNAGRLDVSLHPFCCGIGPGDTRMTTRHDENYFGDTFFSVLHETGHGLYDQGLPAAHFGTPLSEAISLGIHESQSRMWENLVGRSRAFWKHYFPKTKALFSQTMADITEDQWVFAINDIRPTFIRVESDEATYNLHILLRFELEQAMITGDLAPADVPAAWTERMKKYLGITPPDDARGCLQDIHWAGGAIGYFPTYTLGNLYAAQFFEQARADLGDLDAMFARGEFRPLLDWLRKNIHRHGKRYTASQLVKKVTGKPLSAEPLLRHLRKKASELYGV
jgi:carboxypeptidase Taq